MEVNVRELILGIMLEIDREGKPSHLAVGDVLAKYQFLPKSDRAFITRVCGGTLEQRIYLDYLIDQVSSVKVKKMKPVIRELLRFSVYQMKFMDGVPDSAVVNEAVKLAKKKGFAKLANFVNGVLRNLSRKLPALGYPQTGDRVEDLCVRYSMPRFLTEQWRARYGDEICERMLAAFQEQRPVTVRLCRTGHEPEETLRELERDGVHVQPAPYVEGAYAISGYDHLSALPAFRQGKLQVQDVSSMLPALAAAPKPGDTVIDLCAAPGGKSLHAAELMDGTGRVEARDVTERKVALIRENAERLGLTNVDPQLRDATVWDSADRERADVVLADVPCSGYGVIGRKPDIKYRADREKQRALVQLQRKILENAVACVKPGGVLLYSTCTIAPEENEEQVQWLKERFSLETESLDPYISPQLRSETTARGYLQLLPGIHDCDGFFLARLRKKKDQ